MTPKEAKGVESPRGNPLVGGGQQRLGFRLTLRDLDLQVQEEGVGHIPRLRLHSQGEVVGVLKPDAPMNGTTSLCQRDW